MDKLPAASQAEQDEFWMKKALELAEKAAIAGEVPVGAVLVRDGKLIARARNQREALQSPLGHAELLVLHRASQKLKSWRLTECTLYVTLEPCVMCAGAIVQSRVPRVVYGAKDPKGGAVESLFQILEDKRLNHRCQVEGNIVGELSSQVLKDFFKKRRT